MKRFSFLITYTLAFFAALLILQGVQKDKPQDNHEGVVIELAKERIAIGKELRVTVTNYSDAAITLEDRCPAPYFEVLRYNNAGEGTFEAINTEDLDANCPQKKDITLEVGQKTRLSMGNYSYNLLSETGSYKLKLDLGETSYSSKEFEVKEPSLLTKAWRTLVYIPILNVLVGLLIFLPNHPLWLAIVILTLVVRTILLVPSGKALKAQKRMQDLQPKLDALKEKYADDQTRLAQETMAFWQQNKVNPFSSCIPLLIQFPILIALFYVISAGLTPDKAVLLYNFLPSFSLADISPHFLIFDLTKRDLIIFPIVIGGLQFLQMQLMMSKANKKKEKAGDTKAKTVPNEVETANKMMRYIMPVMIAIFTSQLPAAVGLYWGVGTIYGIGQQLMVNREGSSPNSTDSSGEEVKIRILKKD